MKCKNFVIHSDDSDFFETESIDTTDYSVEQDALWCLRKNFYRGRNKCIFY